MRTRRMQVNVETYDSAARAICRRLQGLAVYRVSRNIALYLPHGGEVNPALLAPAAWRSGKSLYLPQVLNGERMRFLGWQADTPMRPNRYGIREPDPDFSDSIHVHDLDLVLLPLVAFDRLGTRLGMGAGYYDRALSIRRRRRRWRKPYLLGIAWDFQQLAEPLPRARWDVPLDGVITETRWLQFASSSD